uniref:Protein THEMIS2 isoform X1 n=2 Tax=Pogona vitticeps TaxID=103695 RepID=A0A6J0V6J2_9SAUR
MESVSFQHYICSLDLNFLPRVVKICSGVYFQGSVYEISGNECCLPTGDLMKIVNVELQNISCKDMKSGHVFQLPLNFKGLFQPISEPPRRKQKNHFGQALSFSKTKSSDCHQQNLCTLQEVLQSATLSRKRLKCAEIGPNELELYPVYNVEAIMHFRNEVVKIYSTLDIEVVDVTEESQHIHFIKPVMLSEVLVMEKVMPVEAEVVGAPESSPVFRSDWISRLYKGTRIHIHSKVMAWKILASSHKGKARNSHFLISSNYRGCFRQCPRTFSSTSELVHALAMTKKLQVVVTKDYESSDGECPLFSIGDRLEVQGLTRASDPSATDTLVCYRNNGDDDGEQIQVPLFLEAGFVEDIRDRRKYTITEVIELFHMPCEVKVVTSDSALDPLSGFSVLTLEAQIKEPFLTVSLAEEPHHTFEIPPRWMDISVFFTGHPPKAIPSTSPPCVEELSEVFYYQLLKQLPSHTPAPPRPPKRKDSRLDGCSLNAAERKNTADHSEYSTSQKPEKYLLTVPKQKNTSDITLADPNQYITEHGHSRPLKPTKSCKQTTGMTFNDDSDHDYEELNEEVKGIAHKMGSASIKH